MIKLSKLPEPKILKENAKKWTEEHLKNIEEGKESTSYLKSRYSHKEIKDSILKETSEKCAYCESKFRHVHHGDIEHIYPKSLDESKRFEWANLTLACEICNQNKSTTDIGIMIDPYKMDPSDHLFFAGTIIIEITDNGLYAKTILDLNRSELLEARKTRLETITSTLRSILNKNVPKTTRQILLDSLIDNECNKSSEYSAMLLSQVKIIEAKFN